MNYYTKDVGKDSLRLALSLSVAIQRYEVAILYARLSDDRVYF